MTSREAEWRRWRRRVLRKKFPMDELQPRVPKGWADPIIYSWSQTGLFAKLARDAIEQARRDKRFDDVNVYRAMLDQFGDFAAE